MKQSELIIKKRTAQKNELLNDYKKITISIRGYLKDSKEFGFEPKDYEKMQKRANDLMEQINNFK